MALKSLNFDYEQSHGLKWCLGLLEIMLVDSNNTNHLNIRSVVFHVNIVSFIVLYIKTQFCTGHHMLFLANWFRK